MTVQAEAALAVACRSIGLDAGSAELIRAGENHLYRLPGGIVARVARPGQLGAALKEVAVSQWLATAGVKAVEIVGAIEQPISVDDRPVTFWRELPAHRRGTLGELATLLRQLHALPAPDFDLPPLAPFVRLRERLAEASLLSNDDRAWLTGRLTSLEAGYRNTPPGMRWCAIHGDAWVGNIATTAGRPVLLDLERFAYGPPEWDLTSVAVSYTTFGSLSKEDWKGFCTAYGNDVTSWAGFELFRDIRELRKVTFAWQLAGQQEGVAAQAKYRLACLRGERGPRPWGWSGVP